jgi:hypothetical protein
MNNFIKQVIEEKFESKKQQRFFYAKAKDKTLPKKKRKKWGKWAKEFSAKTNFKKLPEKKEKEVDEIVDTNGNIIKGKKPTDLDTRGVTSNSTSDEVASTAMGQMGQGTLGAGGNRVYKRFWGESDMSTALGYEDTLGKDKTYNQAYNHFTKELGLSHEEAIERLGQLGYEENLPDDKVRLVENPRKFIEEYLESLLAKKTAQSDIVQNDQDEEEEEKEINPIILKQIRSLKNTLNNNNLSVRDILKHLKDNE